jgi:hypothetical protein
MATNVIKINQRKVLVKEPAPTFHLKTEDVRNEHKAQVFLDYGSEPGPWVRIGINDTAYGIGYLPEEKKNETANSHNIST